MALAAYALCFRATPNAWLHYFLARGAFLPLSLFLIFKGVCLNQPLALSDSYRHLQSEHKVFGRALVMPSQRLRFEYNGLQLLMSDLRHKPAFQNPLHFGIFNLNFSEITEINYQQLHQRSALFQSSFRQHLFMIAFSFHK
jgi:hypothetical protein